MKTGIFITLEGIEGVGKTTHAPFIREFLAGKGRQVVLTREPGGTSTGEMVRNILLHAPAAPIADLTELLLIFSARAQHLQEVILPALNAGNIVICDRFTDATYAYQGGGRNMNHQHIRILEALVQEGLKPDMTFLFDAPVAVGRARAGNRGKADRFESQSVVFFERVRAEYLALALAEPERIYVIDADRPVTDIQTDITKLLAQHLPC